MIVVRTFSKKGREKKEKKGLSRNQKLALGLGATSALALGALALKGSGKLKIGYKGGHVIEGGQPKVNQEKVEETKAALRSKWVNREGKEVAPPKDNRFMYNKETGKEVNISNTEELRKALEDPNVVIQL